MKQPLSLAPARPRNDDLRHAGVPLSPLLITLPRGKTRRSKRIALEEPNEVSIYDSRARGCNR